MQYITNIEKLFNYHNNYLYDYNNKTGSMGYNFDIKYIR